jgi:hypothetical protein
LKNPRGWLKLARRRVRAGMQQSREKCALASPAAVQGVSQ